MTTRRSTLLAGVLAVTLAGATPAAAQTRMRPYGGVGIGAFTVSADAVDGRSVAAALFGGMALSRYVDAEIEICVPSGTFTRSYVGPSVSFAPPGSSSAEHERLSVITRFDKERDVTVNLSAVMIVHPPAGARVTAGIIFGVSSQRARSRAMQTPVSIPEGVDPLHPSIVARSETSSRNIGGPTIGAQVVIALTPRVAIVPDARYDYGSIGDEINNAFRTSLRLQWRF